MSENITHTAVTDDCVRLALNSPTVCDAFKHCMRSHLNIVRLAGVTRSGGSFMPQLLEKIRGVWANRKDGDLLEKKLAFVLGWHCHRAADLQFKPVFVATDADCDKSPTDCSIYHDVFLFREIYASGLERPYWPTTLEVHMQSDPMAKTLRVDRMEECFYSVWQQSFLRQHSFVTKESHSDNWIKQLIDKRQGLRVDIKRYAEAFSNPSPDRTRRFIVDINFYNGEDPLIRLARSIQNGRPDKTINLHEAVGAAKAQSLYARALRRGYTYLQAASDYFQRQIDLETLKDKLERRKQGIN
jgi:hypothetical protein